MRNFAEISDTGEVPRGVFYIGRDGYQLEAQLRRLHVWVASGTGGSVPHLSTKAQRALVRYLDAFALACEAAEAMTLADATASHARMRSETREPNPDAAAAAERDRNAAIDRLRRAVQDAIGAEGELARELG